MKRVIYYGTCGREGHYPLPIYGDFTDAEINDVTYIDSDRYHNYLSKGNDMLTMNMGKGFLVYAVPWSVDDKRYGCVTAVFVEEAGSKEEILDIINNNEFLKRQFTKDK